MTQYYWNDWYTGWGYFLWFGMFFLLLSSVGNWGYTYSAHRRQNVSPKKDAFDLLNERYAKGEILHEEYKRIRSDIKAANREVINSKAGITAQTSHA